MRKYGLLSLLWLAFLPAVSQTQAQSSFEGVFLTGDNLGPVAGKVILNINGGQVSFQSTLFQNWVSGTLEPVLRFHGKKIPFGLGAGTRGSFSLGEFLGPIPGVSPAFPCGPPPGIDPGFYPPLYFDDTRFTGLFTTPPGLENALRASGGTVQLQIQGTLFSAELANVTPGPPVQFTANFSGDSEVPPNESSYHGTGAFTLSGNTLQYNLTFDAGFLWLSAGILGPAGQHSNSANLISVFDISLGVFISPGQVFYSGCLALTDEQSTELKRGKLYVNFFTTQFPDGELRGQILPASR